MSDWRDDLPPIPADRIRAEAVREGTQRRQRRERRQRSIILAAMGAAGIALVVVTGVLTRPAGDEDDAASMESDAAATVAEATEAAATEAPAGTDAAEDTTGDAAAATTAASAATTAAGAEETTVGTVPIDYTTIGGPGAELPVNTEILVVPAVIWEEPPGGPACGPTTLEVVIPDALGLTDAVVRWQTGDLDGEVATIVDQNGAHATIGPFGQQALGPDVRHELLVLVAGTDQFGVEQIVRAPSAVLIDCP